MCAQLLPAAVNKAFAGQGIELGALDRVHNLRRLAGRGDVVEPAARSGSVLAEHEDSRREGIAPAEIVEEPAVEFRGAQGGLDFRDTFRRCWVGAHG